MDMSLYIMLYVGLPLLGMIIAVYTIKSRYDETMRKIKTELNWEKKYAKSKGKMFLFCTIDLVPVIYGLMCISLINLGTQYGVTDTIAETVALSGGIIIGISGFSTIIGSGLITCEAMKHVPRDPYIDIPTRIFMSTKEQREFYKKHADVFKEWTFAKYVTLNTIPHTVSIYGLLITVLLFLAGGLLNSKPGLINVNNLRYVMIIAYIFAASSIGAILSGYLPTKVKGEIKESKVFGRKIIFASNGHLPALFGLIICLYLMVRYGML
ncbi:MAG: hypothetical protein QMC80_05050 [Thermoplasmatales archaeon]|nr:hypothetical protein [Thermoplasmatales archaeon]